jgi:hypothetical protein
MARSIFGSVGRMGGKNSPVDVVTVQQLLFQVPPTQGGTAPPVEIDGLCGPKTIGAIQKFQLHHFGWGGADGRVDPGGPTLAKLNEFDLKPTAPTPVTSRTPMVCIHGGAVSAKSLRGTPVLTTSDQFSIQGCIFAGSPCVRVVWNGPPGRALKVGDFGQSVNAFNRPQGIVTFT